MEPLPKDVRACLWSYDVDRIGLEKDKKRIITNVLTRGTARATDWLARTYPAKEIAAAIEDPLPGEWDPKSFALWSLVYGAHPADHARALSTSHARLLHS